MTRVVGVEVVAGIPASEAELFGIVIATGASAGGFEGVAWTPAVDAAGSIDAESTATGVSQHDTASFAGSIAVRFALSEADPRVVVERRTTILRQCSELCHRADV
jgi:hypothetical protein